MAMVTPQSNQRGIETKLLEGIHARKARGLNRTSVGLKPFRVSKVGGFSRQASIEPAWD